MGDKIRKIIDKEKFDKGYTEIWSSQKWIIDSVRQSNAIWYYTKETLGKKSVPILLQSA